MITMDRILNGVNYSSINFGEIYNVQFLKHNKVLAGHGFNLVQPNLLVLDCPDLEKLNITSRDFGTPYIGIEDQIGGNLYSWIHQSFGVLWQVNTYTNEIVIYSKTCEKLGMRFATLLKMEREIAIHSVYKMSISLALLEIVWEKYYKNKLVSNTTVRNGELKCEFIFGFSNRVFEKELDTLKVLERFVKMFRKDWNDSN
jgi:hypothetical protein